MAIFFFVVGLEIKYEIVKGELANPRRLALPVLAALGGMIVPAAIYWALNAGPGGAPQGWPTPVATRLWSNVSPTSDATLLRWMRY